MAHDDRYGSNAEDVRAVANAVEAIIAFNDEFGTQTPISEAEALAVARNPGDLPSRSFQHEVERGLKFLQHEDALTNAGLVIGARSSMVIYVEGSDVERTVAGGEVKLLISAPDRFVRFINNVRVEDRDLIAPVVERAIENTVDQLERATNPLRMDLNPERFEGLQEAVAYSAGIASAAAQLGISTPSSRILSEVSKHARAGNAAYYLSARELGLYDDVGNDGPGKWHEQIHVVSFRLTWNYILELVSEVSSYDAAQELARELVERAQQHLANFEVNYFAHRFTQVFDLPGEHDQGFGAEFDGYLAGISDKLDMVAATLRNQEPEPPLPPLDR